MKMTRLEKLFVNRINKGKQNILKLEKQLCFINKNLINNVLEIGCGFGAVSNFLHKNYNFTVLGTDGDPEQIKIAHKYFKIENNLKFLVEDATKLSFKSEIFDLVVAQNVFHHIYGWEHVIAEISRVLKTEKYLFLCDFSIPQSFKTFAKPLLLNSGIYTMEELSRSLDENKLKICYSEIMHYGVLKQHNLILQKIG